MHHLTEIMGNQRVFMSLEQLISEETSKVYHQKTLTKGASCYTYKRKFRFCKNRKNMKNHLSLILYRKLISRQSDFVFLGIGFSMGHAYIFM